MPHNDGYGARFRSEFPRATGAPVNGFGPGLREPVDQFIGSLRTAVGSNPPPAFTGFGTSGLRPEPDFSIASVNPQTQNRGFSSSPVETPTGATQGLRRPAPTQGNFEDFAARNEGLGLSGQPTIEGPRIIRREGQTPLLTNLTGDRLYSAMDQGNFVRNEATGQEISATGGFGGVTLPQAEALGLRQRAAAQRQPFYNEGDFGDLNTADFGVLIAANRARAKQNTYDNLVAQGYDPAEAEAEANLEATARQGVGGLTEARNIAGLRGRLSARRAQEAELGLKRSQLGVNQANAAAATLTAQANAAKIANEISKGGDQNIEFTVSPPGVLDQFGSQKQSTLKIGKDEFPIDNAAAVTLDNQAKTYAQQYFDQYPDASDSYESIYKKAIATLLRQQGGNLGIRTAAPLER